MKLATDLLSDGAINEGMGRCDPISYSQVFSFLLKLYFAKSALSLACDERSKGMKGGLMKEKNFSSSQVSEIEKFNIMCNSFKQLMDIHGIVRKSSDLSLLWFKEFYLELSRQVQVYMI